MAYKELSLKAAGQFDYQNNLRNQLTGWGIICKMRRELKISRKERRKIRQAQERN